MSTQVPVQRVEHYVLSTPLRPPILVREKPKYSEFFQRAGPYKSAVGQKQSLKKLDSLLNLTSMKSKIRPLLVILLSCSTALHAGEETLSFAQESSIPPFASEAFKSSRAAEKYAIATQVNPFYIQGDFNGDGRLDCALLIKEKSSGKLGIAIVNAGQARVRVLGAGQRFGSGGDNFVWLDAWYAYSKGKVHPGASGAPPPGLKGDALMVIKTEAASALIYWTGTQYRWYQQGD